MGIGANTAIFSIPDARLLRPLTYERTEDLVSIGGGSAGELLGLRERLNAFREIAAYRPQQYALDNGGEVTRMYGAAVTPNLFRTLGVAPMIGSAFTDEQGVAGKNMVVILSYRLWQREFGGAADVVGKRVLLEAAPFTVVGVMPPDFRYPSHTAQFWVPLTFNRQNAGAHWAVQNLVFMGRVKPGVTVEAAIADVRATWPTMRRLNPLWDPGESYGRDVAPSALQERMIGAPKSL